LIAGWHPVWASQEDAVSVRLQLVQDFLEAQLPVLRPRLYPRGVSSQDDAEPIPALSLGGIAAIELVRRWVLLDEQAYAIAEHVAVFDSRHDSLITYEAG